MTKKDFLYALECENLIRLVRDEDNYNRIDVEASLESRDCETGCRMPTWEWLDIKTIVRIIEEQWGFED